MIRTSRGMDWGVILYDKTIYLLLGYPHMVLMETLWGNEFI